MATLPTLPTFTDGDSDLTSLQELSQAVSYLVDCDVKPTWHLYKTATQSLSSGTTYQAIDFGSWIYDSDGVFDEPGVLIVTPGYYKTEACVQVQGNGTEYRFNAHFVVTFGSDNPNFSSGVTKVYGSRGRSAASEITSDTAQVITSVCPYVLYPGDVITVNVSVGNAVTLDNNVNTNFQTGRFVCNFTGMWIAVDANFTPTPPQDHINGFTLHTASADFNAQAGKFYIISATGGDVTVTLPKAATSSDRAAMLFKRQAGSDHIILKPQSGEKINNMPNSFVTDGLHIDQAGQGVWVYKGTNGWWAN